MLSYIEVAKKIPCTQKDIRKLVARGIVTGTVPKEGKDLLFSDDEVAKIAGVINRCPYAPTDVNTGRYFRECSKGCGTSASGFEEVERVFGFSKVKASGYKRSRSLCRECHRQYANDTEDTTEEPTTQQKTTTKPVETRRAETPAVFRTIHRLPNVSTVEIEDAVALQFGPITLDVVNKNTAEGSLMIPEQDKAFALEPKEALVIANALKNAEATWIWGPSGVGKTSGVRQVASLLNWPVYRVQMSADFSLDDFVGTTEVVPTPEGVVTKFVDGVLIRAMLNGGILLIDEVTGTPPHVLLALQAVLERVSDPHAAWEEGKSHATFVNTANGGEVVHAHANFRVIVTDNTNGQGDTTGMFAGTNVMNEATRSRFTQWYKKGFPDKNTWFEIVASKTPGLHPSKIKQIVELATTSNAQSRSLGAPSGACDLIINPRDTLAVARLALAYGSVRTAFIVGVGNSIDMGHPDSVYLDDLLRNIVGSK